MANKFNQHLVEKGAQLILQGLGVDLKDHNYLLTPERYARALREMFIADDTDWATFEEKYNDFVMLRGHQVYSLCPHHLLPVFMKVSIAYIPDGKVLGISKLARLIDDINNGPMLQERLTELAPLRLSEICSPNNGIACAVSGRHMCMSMRGVKSQGDLFTSKLTGDFETNTKLADRFFRLVGEQRV
jgi:GTP cyclohydrolase I